MHTIASCAQCTIVPPRDFQHDVKHGGKESENDCKRGGKMRPRNAFVRHGEHCGRRVSFTGDFVAANLGPLRNEHAYLSDVARRKHRNRIGELSSFRGMHKHIARWYIEKRADGKLPPYLRVA